MKKRADMTPEERAEANAKAAAWRRANPDKVRAYNERWRRANKGHNPEGRREQNRQWRRNNPDKVLEYRRRYYARHTKQIRIYQRAYYAAHYAKGRSSHTAALEALNAALGKNTLYATAAAAIPATLPPHVRDDAIQSLILAVLEGEVSEAAVAKHAKRFISGAWGLVSQHGMRSLDATIPGTERLRLLDTLSAEVAHL